jgi:hypothetical protein
VLRLKSQIRKLLTEHSYEDILSSFEEDLSRLQNENQSLKQRNMQLEELRERRLDDSASVSGRINFNTTNGSNGNGNGTATGGVATGGDPGISWSANEGMVGGTSTPSSLSLPLSLSLSPFSLLPSLLSLTSSYPVPSVSV